MEKIDTVIRSKDEQWLELDYYQDVDCNGTIDVIGHKGKGSKDIDSYRRPEKPLRLDSLAKELNRAFKRQKIPYPTVRVCQSKLTLGSYKALHRTAVYSQPRVDSPVISTIEPGAKVNVVDIQGIWLKIRSKHGRPSGFIREDSVVPVGSR